MWLARAGYVLILAIVASALVAIAIVVRPENAEHPQFMEVTQVINYSRFGQIESIEQHGRTLSVRFQGDFDTKGTFGSGSHVFESTLPEGQTIAGLLEQAGVKVNGDGGVRVTAK